MPTLKFDWTLLAPLALGAMLVAPAAMAQDQADDQPQPSRRDRYQDWTLTCFTTDAGENCNLSQAFVEKESGKPILRAIVRKFPNMDNAIMILAVPLGVDLRKGASLKVTEDKYINKLEYTMCLPDGCRLQFPLTQEAIDIMGAAGQGQLIVGRPNQEKNVGVPISFNGFAEAYTAFMATQK